MPIDTKIQPVRGWETIVHWLTKGKGQPIRLPKGEEVQNVSRLNQLMGS